LSLFDGFVRAIATPTFETSFASVSGSTTPNTGSEGGTFTTYSYTVTAGVETGFEPFKGYASPSLSNSRMTHSSTQTTAKIGRSSSQDRTWIYAWTNTGTIAGILIRQGNIFGLGQTGTLSGTIQSGSVFCNSSSQANVTKSQTNGGSVEALPLTATTINLLACSWDYSANTLTYRWKATGHAAGFNKAVQTSVSAESPQTQGYQIWGHDAFSISSGLKARYAAIIDTTITDEQFQLLTETAGL
jgi:hypothetical protein